jgi:hypothetical protein
MLLKLTKLQRVLLVFLLTACAQLPFAHAALCTTQSQMTPTERDTLSTVSRGVLSQVQSGNVQALQQMTLPAVAADFNGLMKSVQHLQPLLGTASITVEEFYVLDSSSNQPGASQTDFFCGSPVVVFNIPNLPPGTYALTILHATGVPQPEQVSLIFSRTPQGQWLLAGMFDRPMTAAGHDGTWYWVTARNYAQTKMSWDAWFYYDLAIKLLDPLDFLSSPNLEKLRHEADSVRPTDLPGSAPVTLNLQGSNFAVTTIDTTTALGGLDLDVTYNPDTTQQAQLHDPISARQQVTSVMLAVLRAHPEVREAFHGIWVHAGQGSASAFALELPMDQIAPTPSQATISNSAAR